MLRRIRLLVFLFCVTPLFSCSEGELARAGGKPGGGSKDDGSVAEAAALYQAQCASCHGSLGEGGTGPALTAVDRELEELTRFIDKRMPPEDPALCTGECPAIMAHYILEVLSADPNCEEGAQPGRRQLRLLSRREYRATLLDLFGFSTSDADCGKHEFVYAPADASTTRVHVAGSFNAWSTTASPLAFDGKSKSYRGSFSIPAGPQSYKFVLNGGTWISDPTNPNREPDGQGGQNSVLSLRCGEPLDFDPTASLPVEARPQNYAYDNHGGANNVSVDFVTEALSIATSMVDALGERVRKLASCDPIADTSCAPTFVRELGQRTFRRPLSDAEVTRYSALIAGSTDRAQGVTLALRALLVSPHFLYRAELGLLKDGGYRLTGWEVASLLSYTLWGTMPDAELLRAAGAGELDTPAGIRTQAERLLEHTRSREVVRTFAAQWLGVDNFANVDKNPTLFPALTAEVKSAMAEEPGRLVEHVTFNGTGSYDELVTAPYSMLDAKLADFYGVPFADASGFAETAFPEGERAGVLGLGAVLGRYAHSNQTSPILRGLFVRRNVLCQAFGAPPANAGMVPEVDPSATTRERFRQHTADASCASCHNYIDDLGFGFERFDAVGRVRSEENGLSIDSLGNMNDVEGLGAGTDAPFSTFAGLGTTLAQSDAAPNCYVRQWFRYAHGSLERPEDRCTIQALSRSFEKSGRNLKQLIVDVVSAPDFVTRVE